MTLRKILALTCLLLPMMASAHQFETGQRVPPIGITDRGELVLDKDQFSYKTWNSAQLVGKVRVPATYCWSHLCKREKRDAD